MKKYSELYIKDFNKLSWAKIGLEFEFYTKEVSYYKLLEILNSELNPIRVHGFRKYHPDFKPTEKDFIITPDLSGGGNMVELITGPLPYSEAKYYLVKILKFIDTWGWTNDRCSIHFNISIDSPEISLNDLNILKAILNIDEEEIWRFFPMRKDNIYAKTVKSIIPYRDYDFSNISIYTVKNNLRLPSDKYYGINFLNINNDKESQRLEFRYIGGKDYQKSIGVIIDFMDKFALLTLNCCDVGFTESDVEELESYLDGQISRWRNINRYDQFLVSYPNIHLQVDQETIYDKINAYYTDIYRDLLTLLDSLINPDELIINWSTGTNKFELVSGKIKTNSTISGVDIIDCDIEKAMFMDCEIHNSEIIKTYLKDCKVFNSGLKDCKILKTSVDNCDIWESFYMEGWMNSNMISGVFRGGDLGPDASISPQVQLVDVSDNFFNQKYDDDKKYGDFKK